NRISTTPMIAISGAPNEPNIMRLSSTSPSGGVPHHGTGYSFQTNPGSLPRLPPPPPERVMQPPQVGRELGDPRLPRFVIRRPEERRGVICRHHQRRQPARTGPPPLPRTPELCAQ